MNSNEPWTHAADNIVCSLQPNSVWSINCLSVSSLSLSLSTLHPLQPSHTLSLSLSLSRPQWFPVYQPAGSYMMIVFSLSLWPFENPKISIKQPTRGLIDHFSLSLCLCVCVCAQWEKEKEREREWEWERERRTVRYRTSIIRRSMPAISARSITRPFYTERERERDRSSAWHTKTQTT